MRQSLKTLLIGAAMSLSLCACSTVKTIPLNGAQNDYVLGVGDKLGISVFNQEKMSGEFTIDTMGEISLPLLEKIPAAGFTTTQLEENIKSSLAPTYLNDPRVSIEILNYRSVYVLGEVEKPGKYEYVPNMTLLQAVATANGYTARADEGEATITRHAKDALQVFEIEDTDFVKPGDTIVVERRWF